MEEITRGSEERSPPVSQGVWGAQPSTPVGGGAGGRSPLVSQGVWGAQPPSVQGVRGLVLQGVRGAQPPSIEEGPGGAAPRYCRGSGRRSPSELQGVCGAQPPSKAGGFGGPQAGDISKTIL